MRANHHLERNMLLLALSLALPSIVQAQSNPFALQEKYAAKYGTTPLKTTTATTPPVFHDAASKVQPKAKDLPAQPTGSQSDQPATPAGTTTTTTTVAPAVDPPQPPKSDGRFHLSKFGKHLFTVVDSLGQVGKEVPDDPAENGVRGAGKAEAAMPTPTGGDLQPAPVAPQPAYTAPTAPASSAARVPVATPAYQAPTSDAKVIKTN